MRTMFRAVNVLMCCALAGWMTAADEPAPQAQPATPPAPAAVVAAPVKRVAQPDDASVKKASVIVRTVYAGRYAVKDERGKRTQARMMLRHAAWHRDDAALEMVLLRESLRLASEASDAETILADIDALDAAFDGVVVADERRKAFEHVARKPFVLALLKLLDAPDDVRSCAVAGRWLGMVAGRWSEALPVLARASDEPAIKALAERETAAAQPPQLREAAQAWLDAAKTVKVDERVGVLKHALELAQRALPGLTGAEQQQEQQFIAKTILQIPLELDQVDWGKLTAEQWERIPAPVIPLVSKIDRTDTQVLVAEGASVRVVPHPTDMWSFVLADTPTPTVTDWKGVRRSYTYTTTDDTGFTHKLTVGLGVQNFLYGAVLMWTDVNHKRLAGVISGPGKIWIGPSSTHQGEVTTSGAIRVKLVPVEE